MKSPSDNTRFAVRLDDGTTVRSEHCALVRSVALDCRFPTLKSPPGAEATVLVPNVLASATGQAVTLWASAVPRVEFQR